MASASTTQKKREELNESQEYRKEQIKQRVSGEEVDTSSRNYLPVPENELELINGVREKIQRILDNKILEAKIEKINSYQRKLLHELIERDFTNKVSTLTKNGDNNQKIMVVTVKRTLEEEMKLENEHRLSNESIVFLSLFCEYIFKC